MDREHFLDSQLWLRHLSDAAMDKLSVELKFYSVLVDAYSCFQVERNLIFFAANQERGDISRTKSSRAE